MCNPIVKKIESLGGEICYNTPVKSVIIKNDSVIGVKAENGNVYRADQIVIASTLSSAKKILDPLKNRECLKNFFSLKTMSACTIQFELQRPALEKDITVFGPSTDTVSFAEQSRSTFRGKKGRLSVILGNAGEYCNKTTQNILETVVHQLGELGINIDGSIVNYRKIAEEDEFYRWIKAISI